MGKRGGKVRAERVLARETPDEISQIFDLGEENFRQNLSEWLRRYQKLMRIKHGSDVKIDLKHENVEGVYSAKLVTAFVANKNTPALEPPEKVGSFEDVTKPPVFEVVRS